MNKYLFFYDESFHDRKVTCKEDSINIYNKDSSDVFVGAFIGINSSYNELLKNKYLEFEEKQKVIYGLESDQELKATTIRKKNFKHGIASFNHNCFDFYHDYFSMFDDTITIHISLLSKTALFLNKVFGQVKVPYYVNRNSLIYSLIKFIYTYRCYDLLIKLFKKKNEVYPQDILNRLRKYMIIIIEKGEKSKKKTREVNALKEIVILMNHLEFQIETSASYLWDYDDIFIGFKNLLSEVEIYDNIDILIDNEDKTAIAANKIITFANISQIDSTLSYGIRMSDILSNFVGRIIKALSSSLEEPKINKMKDLESYDFKTKKLLSPSWFKLNQEQYSLYKLLYKIFIIDNGNFWTIYGLYCVVRVIN